MAAKRDTSPPRNFQDAIRELEQILQEIERGDVGLEESLVKYERGQLLIRHCQQILGAAEKQIEEITKAPDGSLTAAALPETRTQAASE